MIVIGNLISFAAAVCMLLSAFSPQRNKLFFLQFLECALLALANIFFASYAGVWVLLLSAVRNILVAKEKYNKKIMVIFASLTVILSLLTNNRGLVGLIPMVATVQYTVCSEYIRGILGTKVSMAVNTLFWIIYSAVILDFSTAISDAVVLLATLGSLWKLSRKKEKRRSYHE